MKAAVNIPERCCESSPEIIRGGGALSKIITGGDYGGCHLLSFQLWLTDVFESLHFYGNLQDVLAAA